MEATAASESLPSLTLGELRLEACLEGGSARTAWRSLLGLSRMCQALAGTPSMLSKSLRNSKLGLRACSKLMCPRHGLVKGSSELGLELASKAMSVTPSLEINGLGVAELLMVGLARAHSESAYPRHELVERWSKLGLGLTSTAVSETPSLEVNGLGVAGSSMAGLARTPSESVYL